MSGKRQASAGEITHRQQEVLEAALTASDGWICRGFSRIWGIAPTAVIACQRKGLLEMPHGRGRARLTPAGRALAMKFREEALPR